MEKDTTSISDNTMPSFNKGCFSKPERKKSSRMDSREIRPGPTLPPEIISGQPPRGKRALLCCVSYKHQKFELKGSSHDLKNMMELLETQFHFPPSSILVLAEKESHHAPTRKNMEAGFQWLMRGIQPNDSLLFYFSGHGLRQRNIHGDEVDGFDESICPVDFESNGVILDNYIYETIVQPLTAGIKLHTIIDSCHSGTVLDLPYVYNMNTRQWGSSHAPSYPYKGTNGGNAICISACEDHQLAADTSGFSPNSEMSGAMTSSFVKAVKNNTKITYWEILDNMHKTLSQEEKVGCVRAGFRRVFRRKIFQDPLLSSTEEFDVDSQFTL